MARSQTASHTIAEMREFAHFTCEEQFFIERSLDIGRGRCAAFEPSSSASASARTSFAGSQHEAYRELFGLRDAFVPDPPIAALDRAFGPLVRISALDLARGQLSSFGAYRFLYERLLGASVRPYLPAVFCAAAVLPQIEPGRRKLLLCSLEEAVCTAVCWSTREPIFIPGGFVDEAE